MKCIVYFLLLCEVLATNITIFSSSGYANTVLYGGQHDLDYFLKIETMKYCLREEKNNFVISFDSNIHEPTLKSLLDLFDENFIELDNSPNGEFSYKFFNNDDMIVLSLNCGIGNLEDKTMINSLLKTEVVPDFIIVNIAEFVMSKNTGERGKNIDLLCRYLNEIYNEIPLMIINSDDESYSTGFCGNISDCMYIGYKYENYGVTQIKLELLETKGKYITLLKGIDYIKPEEITRYQVFCKGSKQHYSIMSKHVNSFINSSQILQSRRNYISLMDKYDYNLKPYINSSFWRFFFAYTFEFLNKLSTVYESKTENITNKNFIIFKTDELKTCVHESACENIHLVMYNTEIKGFLIKEFLENLGYFEGIVSPFLGDYAFSTTDYINDDEESYKLITTNESRKVILSKINNINPNFLNNNWSFLIDDNDNDNKSTLNFSILLDNLINISQVEQTNNFIVKFGKKEQNVSQQYKETIIYISVIGGLCIIAGLIVGLVGRNKP